MSSAVQTRVPSHPPSHVSLPSLRVPFAFVPDMSCNQGLYCSPSQYQRLFPQQSYSFLYNSQFGAPQNGKGHGQGPNGHGKQNTDRVDIYLFNGNRVVQKYPNVPNNGQFGFTVDQV